MARIAGIVQVNTDLRDYAALADDFEWMKGRLRADRSTVFPFTYPPHSGVHFPPTGLPDLQVLLALLQAEGAAPNGGSLHVAPDGKRVCVLDGSLYGNRHSFASDAACLLHEFEAADGNSKCFNQFSGKFAGVLLDFRKGSLCLFRDPLGVKPMFYRLLKGRLLFASEPKALLLPNLPKALHPEGVFDFLVKGKIEVQEQTLFAGICQVQPGSVLHWNRHSGVEQSATYFQPQLQDVPEAYRPGKFRQYRDQVKVLLDQSVRNRLEKHHIDQPAALLSGGLDSSILTSILRAGKPDADLIALSAVLDNPALSENQWARKMVEQVHAHWIKVQPRTDEFSTDLEDFIYSQDTPTLSSGTYLQYRLFQAAGERGIPLLFDGQAADGLFGGHQFHYYAYWKDLRRLGQWRELQQDWKRFGGFTTALKYSVSNSLKYNYLSRMPLGLKTRFYEHYYPELNYLNRDFWQSYKSRLHEPAPTKTSSLNQMLYQGFYKGTMPFLLKCVDRASNYFGVESAMPFAEDRNLYEYVHAVPGIYKIHAGHRKWLLKEAYREQLPPAIYNRSDKMALLSPNNQWLRELRPVLRPYFEALDGQVLDKQRLLKDFDEFFNPKSDLENYRIYKFAAFALWRHVFGL